jgi:alkylation response protein AidB-like acyl-CoA dehydrogenase
MQRSYNEALAFAKTHSSAGKPIIAHQEVGFKLAEMLTLLQTAQLLAYRAAWMDETDQREAEIVARCAKVFSSEASEKIAAEALQILGARGFFQECASAEDFKVSKYLQVSGTSSERSRVRIGDGVLRQ